MRPHRRQPTRLPRPWDSPGKNTGVGCHFLLYCMKVKSESEVAQSYLTLSDPMDCSLPGSSVHGIFQARVLEWFDILRAPITSCGRTGPFQSSLPSRAATGGMLDYISQSSKGSRAGALGKYGVPLLRSWQVATSLPSPLPQSYLPRSLNSTLHYFC